jgi:ATP synthase protein I
MTEGGSPPPLKDFDARLKAARDRQNDGKNSGPGPALPAERGAGAGYRVAIELIAGMIFGGLLGWWLDRELGTKPWLMVLLFLLGSAAGMLNAYRAMMRADRVEPETSRPTGSDEDGRKKKD